MLSTVINPTQRTTGGPNTSVLKASVMPENTAYHTRDSHIFQSQSPTPNPQLTLEQVSVAEKVWERTIQRKGGEGNKGRTLLEM